MKAWKLPVVAAAAFCSGAYAVEPEGIRAGSGVTLLPTVDLTISDDNNIYSQDADTTSSLVDAAEASEAPSADMMSSAFQQAEADLQQAEVAPTEKTPEAPIQDAAPAGFAADLDGPAPVSAPIIKPKEVATASGESDLVAEIEVKETAEAKAAETADVEDAVEETPKMQAPEAPKQEAASQPVVSAPAPAQAPAPAAISTSSVSASSSAPVMQSTMQTSSSSMSSSSFDADQLDIPAFLRR